MKICSVDEIQSKGANERRWKRDREMTKRICLCSNGAHIRICMRPLWQETKSRRGQINFDLNVVEFVAIADRQMEIDDGSSQKKAEERRKRRNDACRIKFNCLEGWARWKTSFFALFKPTKSENWTKKYEKIAQRCGDKWVQFWFLYLFRAKSI